jgi:hypothetical protein
MPNLAQIQAFEVRALTRLQAPINSYYDAVERFGEGVGVTIADRLVRTDMARVLRNLHTEAALIGADGQLDADQRDILRLIIEQDLGYLSGFMDALSTISRAKALARCNAYVATLRNTINEMIAFKLPKLPVYPGDATQLACGRFCKCILVVERLPGTGNFNVRWVLDALAEHCEDCLRYARLFNPLQIRNGVVPQVRSIPDADVKRIAALIAIASQKPRSRFEIAARAVHSHEHEHVAKAA